MFVFMFFTFWVVVELTSQDEMVLDMLHYLYIIYILGLSADFWLQRYDKKSRCIFCYTYNERYNEKHKV